MGVMNMLQTLKNKMNAIPNVITQTSDTDKILKQIATVGGKDLSKAIDYLNKYEAYKENLNELVSFYQYINGVNDPVYYTFVSIEVLPDNDNHAVRKLDTLLVAILNKVLSKENEDMDELSIDNLVKSKNLSGIYPEFENSFVSIADISTILDEKPENKKKIINFLKKLSSQTVLIFKGSKSELSQIHALMDITYSFNFNCSAEYSFEELADVMEKFFNREQFSMEKDWKRYLRNYLSKPTEANRVKNFSYYDNLTENLKKKALTDLKQKKTSSGKVIIKNEYFGVSLEGGNFTELKSLKELDKLIGMEEAKQSVKELIAYLEFNQKLQVRTGKSFPLNLHMMFTGSPGTGKTTIARVIANILFELGYIKNNNLVEVDKKDLVSQWVGHTSIKTNEVIQRARGGVLFIDEAYSVPDDSFGKDAIATLIKAMEDLKSELVVIVAGYKDEMEDFVQSNPGIHSRLGKKIHFEDYNTEELMGIYDIKLKEYDIHTEQEAKDKLEVILAHFKETDNFGNGRFVDNLIQDLLFAHAVNTLGVQDEDMTFIISTEDLPKKYEDILNQPKPLFDVAFDS